MFYSRIVLELLLVCIIWYAGFQGKLWINWKTR